MLTRIQVIVAVLALSSGVSSFPAEAVAQSEIELQALRQLEFSKAEVEKGSFERALSSASAAFRLDPTLYDALAYKALAYEGLGELRLAEGLLTTYMDIRGGADPLVLAEEALERVSQKLGGASDGASDDDPESDSSAESTPTAEDGEVVEEPDGAAQSGDASDDEEATDEAGSAETSEDEVTSAPEGTASEDEGDDDAGDGEAAEDEKVDEVSARPDDLERLAELLPTDASLAALHLMHQRGIVEARAQLGLSVMAGGMGLSALGGILMAVSSTQYAQAIVAGDPTDQSAAVYAGAMGMLGAGGAVTAVGVPLFVMARVDLKKLDSLERSLAVRPAPRLELMAQGLRFRF